MSTRFRLERQFGAVVGGVFVLIGQWTTWRVSWPPVVSWTMAGVGLGLVVLGLTAPRVLVYPRRAWMALAEALGFVSTRVILGVVFFLIITPLGLVMRRAGWDPLSSRRRSGQSAWAPYPSRMSDPRHFEQMF
jgi:hypothetical protein